MRKRNKKNVLTKVIIIIIVAIFLSTFILPPIIGFFSDFIQRSNENQDNIDLSFSNDDKIEEEQIDDRVETIRITAVGDIMMHSPQIKAGYYNGKYNYDSFFEHITAYIDGADIAIANLETTFAGEEKEFTGYPMFNSPDELADALKKTGFNILGTANNHSMDRYEYGVIKTIENLETRGIDFTGTARSQNERDKLLIKDIRGVKVAVMAYTYSTNGIPIPHGKEYLVNLIDLELIERDVLSAREEGVDIIIMNVHFGDEYQRYPNTAQKELVDQLFDMGVHIVLGSHPHVIQPMERRTITNKHGETKECFVIYSLGNFVSNQTDRFTDSGVILNLNMEKRFADGHISITDVSYIPTWVNRYYKDGKSNYRVLPVETAIRKFQNNDDAILNSKDNNRLLEVWKETTEHLEDIDQEISVFNISD